MRYPATREQLAELPYAAYLTGPTQQIVGPPTPTVEAARVNALALLNEQYVGEVWEAWIVQNVAGAVVAGYRREGGSITIIHEGGA